ncbi:MAG: T9SS type A sorting domain-containing protein [Bacteroidales bacterium]|nr:T9SS type A sorting domain-containing protein [Bacteroidales bacterium]
MKKLMLMLLLMAWAVVSFAQGIYNNGAHIVSTSGSYWVLDNGGFTLTSASATNLAQLDNLSIEGDASLTLPTSTCLTVNGTLNNKSGATLTVNSGASLITSGSITNNGTITMHQTLTGAVQAWHMISGPAVADISNNGWSPTLGYDDLYAWHEASPGTWVNYHVTSGVLNFPAENGGSDNFVAGKGYLAAYNSEDPAKMITGTPNTGDVTFNLKNSGSKRWTYKSGWNLLGNPYPSAIDWNTVDHTATSLFQDNFAYVYDPNKSGGEDYITIDGSSPDAFIAPFQGFMVLAKTNSNDQTFTFTNAMRDHGGGFYKNQKAGDGLVLRLGQENWYDETTIRMRDESEPTRDRQDALKLFSFNPNKPQLFTITGDDFWLAVNSMPKLDEMNPVPLGLRLPEEGVYEISITNIPSQLSGIPLYIEDLQSGQWHRVDNKPMSFTAYSGDITDRFVLHPGAVGVEETDVPSSELQVFLHDKNINIINNNNLTGEITILNILGQQMDSFKLESNLNQSHHADFPSGVYVVYVKTSAGQVYSEKVIVN